MSLERADIILKLTESIKETFKNYTVRQQHSNITLFLQDSLQKDLNITDKVPYIDLYLTYSRNRRGGQNNHKYKLRWSTNPSTEGTSNTYWEDSLLEKGTVNRIIKRKITKMNLKLEEHKKYEIERKQKEAVQAEEKRLRLEKVKQFLDEKEVGYTLDSYASYYQLTTAPNVHVYRVTDVCVELYVWDRTMRYVKKEQFMDVITSAHTIYYSTFEREPI